MKIIQIITSLHSAGAEKFVIDLSNELSKNNEIILCSLYDIKDSMFLAKSINKNIKVVTLNKRSGLDLKMFLSLRKLIKKENPDVVHTHLRALFYSSLSIVFSNIPFCHTVHSMADKETTYFFRKFYYILFKYFNVVPVAISKKVLKSIQHEYSNNFNVLIENGVKKLDVSLNLNDVKNEIHQYKTTNNTKVFLTIGRIGKEKNHVLLIRTINKLVSEGYDIVLLVIGDDYGALTMLKSIACDKVYFLGLKQNVIDYISQADAFCMSSIYEGLPIVLLESLSMGCIPICTPAGGIVDVVDESIGFLSKGFDESEYYEVMYSFLMKDDQSIQTMQKGCLQIFKEKYNIPQTAFNYNKLYTQLSHIDFNKSS